MELKNTIFIFDVDSTIVKGETLEEVIELAISNQANKDILLKRIQEITNLGMEGKIDFKKSLEKRLSIVRILQKHLDLYNDNILTQQTDFRFKEIMQYINSQGGKTFIVSGGFMDNIKPLAESLDLDEGSYFANEFVKEKGEIVGFNKSNPLSESDGKVKIVQEIKNANKDRQVICIGDGNSDYLIKKEGIANEFWGFWANVKRRNIEKKADRNFYSSKELLEFIKSIVDKNILSVNR
jgi:D-3-phosphoglycerate dehydrogenase